MVAKELNLRWLGRRRRPREMLTRMENSDNSVGAGTGAGNPRATFDSKLSLDLQFRLDVSLA